ncbi:MAG TPA: hypothetical protein VGB77_15580 [Abditibacteriaceae bacterium]
MFWGKKKPSTLAEAVENLIALQEGTFDPKQFQQACVEVTQQGMKADKSQRDQALAQLKTPIEQSASLPAALIALVCGALVEQDADGMVVLDTILTRAAPILREAAAFAAYCHAKGQDKNPGAEDNSEINFLERYGAEVAPEHPNEAMAWDALDVIYMPLIAMLSQSSQARRMAKQHERYAPALETYINTAPISHGGADWLWKMQQVLDDEELLVIHRGEGKGFKVRIGGIADNFHLHDLLAQNLIGNPTEGLLSGQVHNGGEGVWDLVNWTGLHTSSDEANNWSKAEHWIWGEGVPADIKSFEGVRVVLLEPSSYVRTWDPSQNSFCNMQATLEVQEVLSPDVVQDYLKRMTQAASN